MAVIFFIGLVCGGVEGLRAAEGTGRTMASVQADLSGLREGEDVRRADLLLELAKGQQAGDPAKALVSAKEAAEVAGRAGDGARTLRATVLTGDILAARGEYDEARSAYLTALDMARKLGDEPAQGQALLGVALAHYRQARYEEALTYFREAETLARRRNERNLLAGALNGQGRVAQRQSRNDEALDLLLRSRALYEETKDTKGMAQALSDVGTVYQGMDKHGLALDFYLKSLAMRKRIGDEYGQSIAANNAGWAYICLNRHEEALEVLAGALEVVRRIQAGGLEPVVLNNIGLALENLKRFDEAIAQQHEALKLARRVNAGETVVWCLQGLASALRSRGSLTEATDYAQQALDLAQKLGNKELMRREHEFLSELAEERKDMGEALRQYKAAMRVKEEIFSEERTRKVSELEARYETERKSREIAQLEMERSVQQAEVRRQTIWRNSALGGFALVVAFAALLYNRFRLKHKSEAMLQMQHTALEERNAAVLSSISYARTIQQALLPTTEQYEVVFGSGNFLVFYRPKDIVSGDFHWLHWKEDGTVLLAVCDCTGHGVPGAFMSVIGHDLLNQTVISREMTDPSEILLGLHAGIRRVLGQTDGLKTVQDGMDVALVRISPDRREVLFAGARRPLWVERPGEALVELRGDRFSIGGRHRTGETARTFQSQRIDTPPGTVLHLGTDGYADQCDAERRAFGSRRLRELLGSLAWEGPLERRRGGLESALENHQGQESQRDDIAMLMIRLV